MKELVLGSENKEEGDNQEKILGPELGVEEMTDGALERIDLARKIEDVRSQQLQMRVEIVGIMKAVEKYKKIDGQNTLDGGRAISKLESRWNEIKPIQKALSKKYEELKETLKKNEEAWEEKYLHG